MSIFEGSSDPIEVEDNLIERVQNRPFNSNTYICLTGQPGECLLIDPGLDPELIDARLSERNLRPTAIFCTHGHFDHLGSAAYFQKKYGAKTYMHGADVKVSQSANFLMMACKIDAPRITVPQFDVLMTEGDQIQVGSEVISCHHTPGHTPGSSFLRYRNHVFTGDTLYRSAVGLVSLPGENIPQLKESILKMWDFLEDDLQIHPGHGGSAAFGKIKSSNRALRAFLGLNEVTS